MQDEIFGPVLPVVEYSSIDNVVSFVRGRDKPLACYIFTNDKETREHVLLNTTSGSAVVNDVVSPFSLSIESLPPLNSSLVQA